MKGPKCFLLCCVFFYCLTGHFTFAQAIRFSGYIYSADDEPLIGATVTHLKSGRGALSNGFGFFSMSVPLGDTLQVSHVGYTPTFLRASSQDSLAVIKLQDHNYLNELTIVGNTFLQPKRPSSGISIGMKQVADLPPLLGEVDMMKFMHMLPGVGGGLEGTSGLYVRGGTPDQALLLLDGVPVYNANHLFGLFSVFNPYALSQVNLHKNDFPARFGGRLSAIVDIATKEGGLTDFEVNGSLGFISSNLAVSGPIAKEKVSFMLSGRRTWLDAFAKPLSRAFNQSGTQTYFFYDLNAKLRWKINQKHTVYASYYSGKDRAYNYSEEKFETPSTVTDFLQQDLEIFESFSDSVFWYAEKDSVFSCTPKPDLKNNVL